jgi:hypothetical protein
LPGNTPACAGKTPRLLPIGAIRWKHPRVRGEDKVLPDLLPPRRETPPRARGRHNVTAAYINDNGNTPACAGKTDADGIGGNLDQKHPRVRGEDADTESYSVNDRETPPRARGRHARSVAVRELIRNTPACAGKTSMCWVTTIRREKHPRVRGEDCFKSHWLGTYPETPPRARGRLLHHWAKHLRCRNTPACAGKTK